MGAYMYPILIQRDPQKVSYERSYHLEEQWQSLDSIEKLVGREERFFLDVEDRTLYVAGTRLETPKEVKARVAKEEGYMKNYTEFYKNKSK